MIIKFIKKKFNLIKICAVFTTVCFVVSTLGANLYAIPLAENANKKYEDVFNKVNSISAEYGKITASKDANSDITIINIQDLHCHPQTQRNISKIITQIADNYNLKKIYVEGGYGDIDTSWLNTIKDEKIKRQIIEGLLEEGILTGSEYYKLTNNNEVELKGIDEEQIHKDNVRRLSWIIANQDKYKDVITKVENEVNMLEKMYVNSRNERFNRDIEKYLTNKIDSRRFYRQLAKYVKDINENPDKYNNITAIRLEDYPNITKFIALRKTSKDIDVREVTQQLQMVINELKNRLPYNVYTRLLSETENLSDSQKVVELITMLCNKEGINLESRYKALNTFLESNGINRELNTVELVQEERQLLSEIRKALSYNNEEYEITFISDFSKYFKDYLEYKLTDADWKYFEKEYEQFRTLYAKYAVVDRIKEIDGDFDEINKYYRINDQRNNIFVANLLKDEEISILETDRVRQDEEILKNSKEVIIAVTGGFHSSELEEILAKKEVNTIVITPSIFEGIEKATKQYKGIIKEQSRFFQHQALAYTLASCTTDEYKKNLLYSMAKEFLGGNVERLKEVLGQDVDLTVFDKLQPLTEQEQEQISYQKNLFAVATSIIVDILPKEGGLTILRPNMDNIILGISEKLVEEGIFLSNGPIFAAERQGLPDLNRISPEVYSRMHAVIQEALVAQEYGIYEIIAEESARKDTSEEDFADEIVDETAESEAAVEDEIVDSSYFSEEEKAELLEKVRDEEKPFSVDQDLVFSVFEKMIVPFMEDNKVDNIDEYYELFLRKLFSLQPEILQFLNDKMDGQSVKDLLYDYDAEVINKNLTYLLARYNKKLSSLTDFSRIVFLFENIEKLNSLSERDFDYFMNLPNQFFIYVWAKSENASQLETKIAVGKKFYDKNIDTDLVKAYFANAEKLKDLGALDQQKFTALNKEAQLFILENAKNTSNIEKILTFYEGMSLSSDFDSEESKDFKDPKFKALVKYISSTEDRDFYDKLFFGNYNEDELRIIVDSIDDIDFIKNYIWKYEDVYKKLFENLVESHIKKVASENNHLALKLILNKEFNQILTESGIDNISDEDNIVARYYSAIAVSRLMYDGAEKEVVDYDFTDGNFIELIKEVTDLYTEIMKEISNIVLLDRDSQIYALCNSERIITKSIFVNGSREFNRFNTDALKEIMSYLNIPEDHLVEYRRVKDIEGSEDNVEKKKASERWLDSIKFFKMAYDKAKGYFVFMGHGEINGDGNLVVYSPKAKREDKGTYYIDNGEATGEDIEVITPEDMANALFELATRSDDPVDLKNITIDLSCCYSYLFARNVYDKLKQKFESENQKESYPTIITAGGLETELGYTIFTGDYVSLKSGEGNLHQGIDKVLSLFQDGSVHALTLGMVGVSEYLFKYSNITMFTSFSDETLLKRIEETKKHISEFFKDSKEKSIEIESTTSNSRVKLKTKVPNLPIFGFEASIFKEDNYAPIWEELFYRFAPALMLTILISVTMMFAPAGFVLFTKIGFAVILTLFQTIFVKAHIVTDWLRAKDSGGEKSSEEVPETSISDKQSKTVDLGKVFEKDLTFEDKINKIFKTVKERLFAVFSDSKDAESFKIFYKTNKIAAEHKDGLIIPTIAFTIPYVVVMCFFPSIQAVMIATIVSMALHAINNIVAKIIKEKGLLQKKKRDIDFQDIQRRIKHIKLLIENPNVERDLPELKEGSFVLKFGLERKAERRAESLLEYEKIRIFFINRLKDEMAKREEIKAELETIKKARKTKKNKAKIQELEEQLEIMEKEYPRIYNELLFADTKEVEKTIDKIDALLSIFEEIDIILDNIENFKLENADDEDAYKEIKALEEDFLDFAENTFMNSLMALYNNQRTTGIHVRRVVGDSNLIGTKMLSGNNVRMMYKLMLSSILHDIGKNLVPLQILDKQGSFDRLERNIMEFHVVFGGIILRSSILRRLSYTAENHHRYTLKTKMDDLGKETEVGDLHIPTISSLDEEKEEQIERIVKFLEEINPDLSFDSASQYPKSLEDIKSILEDNDMDLTESQQEKLDDLLREIEQIEEEVLIAKIVSLADVFEAVSPKLSFDSERTYQFPQKIRDISSMLENIDIDLTESQKREVIVLLAEIAQIDSEDDAAKKQEMEQKFIKKVLYDRSKSAVIKYVREKNYELIRENAFKIIFTKSPKKIFEELGKTEEEFMADFENDPKGTIDECMSLVDADKFEFDSDVIRAFLEFYFSSEDIRVNNAILESLNKGEENRFIVYIKDLLYSVHKLFRVISRMLIRFAPVIASIFHEEQTVQTDFDKYFKGKKVFLQQVEIKDGIKKVKSSELLEFDGTSVKRILKRLPFTVQEKDYDRLGIIVEKDSFGNIISVKAKEGYEFSSLSIDGEPVGNEKNNLNFSLGQISAMLRDVKILDYDSPDIKEDEMDKYVAHIYLDDADVPLDADKDGYENALEKAIQEAISGNKLMIIHIFRKGFITEDLTVGQLYGKYEQAYSLIQKNRLKNLPSLSKITTLEEDVEVDKNITFDFFLQELLKNHFGHGNRGLFEYPIACHISKNGSKMLTYDSQLNLYDGRSTYPITQKFKDKGISSTSVLEDLLYDSRIQGDGQGRSYMRKSLLRDFEDSRNGITKIGGYRFFKAEVISKFDIDDEKQIEAARQYKKEQDEKAKAASSSVTSASTENDDSYSFSKADGSKTSSSVYEATEEDWAIFWGIESILKPFGVKLGNYAHVWEEALFRYLPTVFILLGYMNPLVGLGIQVVFILAHPLAKWMAARMNWEKAKKEGKQVGEKAGIGDLFKQIGKDFSLLTPTLVMMLPYVGALLSLAINPALSLIITPAIFTFTDVIVKWLTKKDSGGEVISIDKNLVIFITIVSLGSYIFLPLIPVIHPIVNALINPIVITNAINAGYLHYEYNKRQQDRSKSLSIIPRNIDTLSTILSGNVGTKRTTILDLVKNATGEVDVNIVHQLFPDVEIPTIQTIYEDAKNDVQNGTADASQYSGTEKGKEKEREIYFLFVFSESSSSPYFSDDLIHAAYYSIFEQSSNFDVAWKAYSNYKNNSRNKDNADAILKMFSAVYAYKTWKDFKEQNPSKVTNDYIEIKSGHVLSFESWVHVCDGHSVFTNGIETIVKNNIRINSFDFYGNDADAINSVVTLNSLLDSMPFIITDPDMFIFELKKPDAKEPFKVYVKRLDDKVYVYVFLPSEDGKRKLISFYSRKYNGTISMKEALRDRIKERVPIANYNNGVNNFVMAVKAYIADSKPEDNNSEYLLVRNFDVNSTDLNITAEEPQLSLQEEVDSSVHGIIDNFIKPSYNRKVVRGKLLDGIDSFIQLAKANVSQTKTIIPFLVLSNKEDICLVLKQLFNITGELTVREAENILIQKFGLDNKIFISQMISANAEFSFLGEEYTNLLKDVLNKICEVIGDNTIDDNKKKEKCSNIVTQFEKDFYNMVYGKIREMKYPYIFGEINTILQSRVTEFEEQPESLGNDYNDPNLPPTDSGDAILPENMGLVNRIMQSKFGNAFVAATVIAFKEFKASMKPSFVDMHQSESGRKGAQQLRDFITRFDVVETDGLAARIIKTILGTIVKGASIVKHIAIDYRYIKASGIQEAISMFGNNTYMDEYGQIHIPPVLIVNDLKGLKNLNNTGIKVNGRYIYQVGQKGMLIYGAEGVNSEDISMAVNESQMIKDAIEQMIREKGYEGVSVEVDGVIQEEGEGVRFDKGITIIGTEELQNQSATYIDAYVSSSIELKRTVGVMYSQKALISLEGLEKDFENKEKDSKKLEEYLEKLKQALYQGRARKIISKTQYNQLQLTSEDIMELRKNGIEIYIDSNEIDMNLKSMGIVGQIVRNNDNQMLIYDYYAQEEVEIEEIGDEATLTDIENKLLNSPNPIMIDIKVLAKTFQRENILGAYKGLNNLIGNLKLKTGIGQLNKADIMSLGYNLDYNKLPLLSMLDESKSLQEYDGDKIEEMLNTVISNLDTNTEIRIILKAIESRKKKAIKENKTSEEIKEIEETEKVFIQIIKERILAKTALTKNYKEFGLKDKKLEILLGEMLYKQIPFAIEDKDLNKEGNVDITYINENNERVNVQGENKGLMEKIRQDTEKAMRDNNVVAINSIIDIILTYGEDYKEKQLTRQLDTNDARNYRAMLSAA